MYIVEFIVGAALLGILVAVVEHGEFPGWGAMIGIAVVGPAAGGFVAAWAPTPLGILGILVSATLTAALLVWLLRTTWRSASKIAGLYVAIRVAFGLFLGLIT